MKIYPLFTKLVDVFIGDGWLNWSRWRAVNGKWNQVGGIEVKNKSLIINQLGVAK